MTFNFIFKGFGSLVQGVLVPSFLKSAAKLLPFSDPTKFFAQKVLNFQKMYNPFDKILVNSTLHLHFVNSTYHFCVSLPLVIWMEAGLCLYKCGMLSRVLSLPASSPFPRPLHSPFPPHCVFLLLRRILSGLPPLCGWPGWVFVG